MDSFFKVKSVEAVRELARGLNPLPPETVSLDQAQGRTLAEDFTSPSDLPGFARSTMDGFAVKSRDTYGSGEGSPQYLTLVGEVPMGRAPGLSVGTGQCARINTGGMLPYGADSVVMLEHTRQLDDQTVEVVKSVAPGTNLMGPTDDARTGQVLLPAGQILRPQDLGLMAALGVLNPTVVTKPRAGIISTGDEVVPLDQKPGPGQVRDVNTTTLAALLRQSGAEPQALGLVPDVEAELESAVAASLERNQLTLLSGGSSVGVRDLTAKVFLSFPGAELLVHGVAVSPGKPFIWVRVGDHHLLGLPGQVASCVVAFHVLVEPLLERLLGREPDSLARFGRASATLARNLPSAPGREEYVRVRLVANHYGVKAEPVFGKSGLLTTLIRGQGLVKIPVHSEGLDAGDQVTVFLFP